MMHLIWVLAAGLLGFFIITSLAYLLTTSPLVPVGAHAVMHVAVVLRGAPGRDDPPAPGPGRSRVDRLGPGRHPG